MLAADDLAEIQRVDDFAGGSGSLSVDMIQHPLALHLCEPRARRLLFQPHSFCPYSATVRSDLQLEFGVIAEEPARIPAVRLFSQLALISLRRALKLLSTTTRWIRAQAFPAVELFARHRTAGEVA